MGNLKITVLFSMIGLLASCSMPPADSESDTEALSTDDATDENEGAEIENKVDFIYEARGDQFQTLEIENNGHNYNITALKDVEISTYEGDLSIWIFFPHHDNSFEISPTVIDPVEYYKEEVARDEEFNHGRNIQIINKDDDYILMTGDDSGVQYFELCGVKTVGESSFHTVVTLTYEMDGSYKLVTEQDCMEILEILRSIELIE